MHDETNGQTSNPADCSQNSASELHPASEALHVLSAEALDLVAGGGNGTIIIQH